MEKLRIAFCGAQGTGKSTLVPLIAEKLCIGVLNKTTQEVMDEFGFKSQNDILNDPAVKGVEFQSAMIKSRHDFFMKKNEEGICRYITDRTPLDSWAYYLVHNSYYASDSVSDELRNYVKDSSKYFDFVFNLVPGLFTVENNGIRNTKSYYQKTIHSVIQYNALDLGYKLITVPSSVLSIDDRVNWILDYLNTVMNNNLNLIESNGE